MAAFWPLWPRAGEPARVPRSDAPSPAHPRFEGDACVLSLLATASCRACVDACPRAALSLDDESLGFDPNACDGCGLCRPACPEGAIEIALAPVIRNGWRGGVLAFAACDRVANAGNEGTMPCLHAIGRREIAALSAEGVERLIVTSGDCDDCPRGATVRLWDLAAEQLRIAALTGRSGVSVARVDVEDFRAALRRAPRQREAVDPARRGFLGLARAPTPASSRAPSAGAVLHAFVPAIDEARCEGCDACARICPHAAIIAGAENGQPAYQTAPEACTGCGLCRDVCPADAIAIERTKTRREDVMLGQHKCRKCGAPFKLPKSRAASPECPICTRRSDRSALFLVKE